MKFGIRGRLPDVINCAKFFGDRFRGLRGGGQILPFSIDLGCRRKYSAIVLLLSSKDASDDKDFGNF